MDVLISHATCEILEESNDSRRGLEPTCGCHDDNKDRPGEPADILFKTSSSLTLLRSQILNSLQNKSLEVKDPKSPSEQEIELNRSFMPRSKSAPSLCDRFSLPDSRSKDIKTRDDAFVELSSRCYSYCTEEDFKKQMPGSISDKREPTIKVEELSSSLPELRGHSNSGENSRRRGRSKRRRRKKDKAEGPPTLKCDKCGISYILTGFDRPGAEKARCLFCDYWTDVEPVFSKNEKVSANFCKVS